MNTRGLMELVVLNIGLDLKVLTPEVFTMMVIMALVTTSMTGPALDLINWAFNTKEVIIPEEVIKDSKFKILISFGSNEKGKSLLRLASSFINKENANITAMHLTLSDEMHSYNLEEYEKERFSPIIEESVVLEQKISTIFKATTDIETEIAEIANQGEYDLLLVGLGKSIFEGTLLGKVLGFTSSMINPDRLIGKFTGKEGLFENSPFDERTRQIISKSKMPLGILVDKDLQHVNQVFIPIFGAEDTFLIDYAQKLIYNNNSHISILNSNEQLKNNFMIQNAITTLENKFPNNLTLADERIMKKEFLTNKDLMIISLDSWKKLVDSRSVWLSNIPSILIIKP